MACKHWRSLCRAAAGQPYQRVLGCRYVTLQLEGKWASDEYASRADCGERLRVKQMKSIGGYAYPTSPASPRDKSPRG